MSKYTLILALHEADQEASTLMEDEKDNKAWPTEKAQDGAQEKPAAGCDFEDAEAIGGAED